ncbi:HEAT repeat domain-containing protein [Bremerella sp. P1]|uniref:HEAT repeat domain-containing protein n=1 Tax=Bremerella sp. P1 TaxID=3026424 RepID=UPI00236825D2|nr:HEAT repeat domain-containing protein [Bremerella sp. P1]WDI42599.1 HEAT repeat domain-containing protein [Bremerella sp. P1]
MTQEEQATIDRFNADNWAMLYRCRWSPEDADQVVPQLLELLKSKDPEIQQESLRALFRIGTPAAPAANQVAELTCSNVPMTKRLAVLAIGQIAYELPEVCVGPVAATLSDPECCRDALRILKYIGEAAAGALDKVKPLLSNPDAKVRRDAVKALAKMNAADPQVIDLIREATNDGSKIVREASSKCLKSIGKR